MLVQVITSWQVIAVTVVLVVYFFIVNYVARIRTRQRESSWDMSASPPEAAEVPGPSETDDLGLEEGKEK